MTFSKRERAILHHLGRGASSREIALGLGITEAAVYVHLTSLCRKLGVKPKAVAAAVDAREALTAVP